MARQYESPRFSEVLVEEELVLPILDSIVEMEGNALMHLQLPDKWVTAPDSACSNFILRYNELLANRPFNCSKCTEQDICGGVEADDWFDVCPGVQQFTCYSCLDNFCNEHGKLKQHCRHCYTNYCQNCTGLELCFVCWGYHCHGCMSFATCGGCSRMTCNNCKGMTCDVCSHTLCKKCHFDLAIGESHECT